MKLGFIGSGKMAGALVEGVLKAGLCKPGAIVVSDKDWDAAKKMASKYKVRAVRDNGEVAAFADAILLCVKPGAVFEALDPARKGLAGKLVISILAGVRLATLKKAAGKARLVRVMPNTPALVHQGAAAYSLGSSTTKNDAKVVERIFSSVGKAFQVPEKLLDAVTGLSGSGPAYIYVVVEGLARAGSVAGLPHPLALQLAAQTVKGAAEMVLRTGLEPEELKRQVMSPNGTTVAGLKAYKEPQVKAAFQRAVSAATKRSRELGKQS